MTGNPSTPTSFVPPCCPNPSTPFPGGATAAAPFPAGQSPSLIVRRKLRPPQFPPPLCDAGDEDRAVGFLLSFISLSIFTYYTFWVIILPFVDDDHFVHKYFLPQEYAILIPVSAGVALLCLLCIFIGFVMLKSKKKKA
ncbi:Dolichol-phosphate mannose synthase subunit 2 [Glycine max]|nr:Dolichol-phosphate mannose synthase subunit 2 [Glycine max]